MGAIDARIRDVPARCSASAMFAVLPLASVVPAPPSIQRAAARPGPDRGAERGWKRRTHRLCNDALCRVASEHATHAVQPVDLKHTESVRHL